VSMMAGTLPVPAFSPRRTSGDYGVLTRTGVERQNVTAARLTLRIHAETGANCVVFWHTS